MGVQTAETNDQPEILEVRGHRFQKLISERDMADGIKIRWSCMNEGCKKGKGDTFLTRAIMTKISPCQFSVKPPDIALVALDQHMGDTHWPPEDIFEGNRPRYMFE